MDVDDFVRLNEIYLTVAGALYLCEDERSGICTPLLKQGHMRAYAAYNILTTALYTAFDKLEEILLNESDE